MNTRSRPRTVPLNERTMRLVVGVLAVFHVAEGLWMLASPDTFFDVVGRYGLENTHYVGDLGAFVLAYGMALMIAVGRPSWRAPLLALGALWYAFHALNHLLDIAEARSDARGIVDTALLALGAGALAWLATLAERAHRNRGAPEASTEGAPRR